MGATTQSTWLNRRFLINRKNICRISSIIIPEWKKEMIPYERKTFDFSMSKKNPLWIADHWLASFQHTHIYEKVSFSVQPHFKVNSLFHPFKFKMEELPLFSIFLRLFLSKSIKQTCLNFLKSNVQNYFNIEIP